MNKRPGQFADPSETKIIKSRVQPTSSNPGPAPTISKPGPASTKIDSAVAATTTPRPVVTHLTNTISPRTHSNFAAAAASRAPGAFAAAPVPRAPGNHMATALNAASNPTLGTVPGSSPAVRPAANSAAKPVAIAPRPTRTYAMVSNPANGPPAKKPHLGPSTMGNPGISGLPSAVNPGGNFTKLPTKPAVSNGAIVDLTSEDPEVPIKHPAPLPESLDITHDRTRAPSPELKIIINSEGIILQWNITAPIPVPIKNFQIYGYKEKGLASGNLWKKVGDLKALALPMACTLTQFHDNCNYHFTVRGIDSQNKPGRFSTAKCASIPANFWSK